MYYIYMSRRNNKRKKGTRKCCKKAQRNRQISRQVGGGLFFNLIPSDIKQIGYFFERWMKMFYNSAFGMP